MRCMFTNLHIHAVFAKQRITPYPLYIESVRIITKTISKRVSKGMIYDYKICNYLD